MKCWTLRFLPARHGDLYLGGRHGGGERVEVPDGGHGQFQTSSLVQVKAQHLGATFKLSFVWQIVSSTY